MKPEAIKLYLYGLFWCFFGVAYALTYGGEGLVGLWIINTIAYWTARAAYLEETSS